MRSSASVDGNAVQRGPRYRVAAGPVHHHVGQHAYVTARLDRQLALVALVITPVLLAVGKFRRDRLRPLDRDARAAESSAMSVIQEALGALRVIKAFGQERANAIDSSIEARRRHGYMRRRVFEISFGLIVSLTIALGTGLVIWFGARHVQAGTLTLGELLLVLSYLDRFYGPMIEMGSRAAGLQGRWRAPSARSP
jgi:ABC-type multidrug transport system fused ATPase/permease subunit